MQTWIEFGIVSHWSRIRFRWKVYYIIYILLSVFCFLEYLNTCRDHSGRVWRRICVHILLKEHLSLLGCSFNKEHPSLLGCSFNKEHPKSCSLFLHGSCLVKWLEWPLWWPQAIVKPPPHAFLTYSTSLDDSPYKKSNVFLVFQVLHMWNQGDRNSYQGIKAPSGSMLHGSFMTTGSSGLEFTWNGINAHGMLAVWWRNVTPCRNDRAARFSALWMAALSLRTSRENTWELHHHWSKDNSAAIFIKHFGWQCFIHYGVMWVTYSHAGIN